MKSTLLVLIMCFLSASVMASEGDMGVGAMVGSPIGVSSKYWLGESSAVDGGIGFSLGSKTNMSVHSDFLLHSMGALVLNDTQLLDLYAGLGGRIKFADEISVGLRIPVGIAHMVQDKNADMFAEIAPVIDFISRTGVDLNAIIGARYYFN